MGSGRARGGGGGEGGIGGGGDERGGSGNARLRCTVLELVAGEHLVRQGVDVIVYAASDVYQLEAREKGNRLRGSYSPLIRRGRGQAMAMRTS